MKKGHKAFLIRLGLIISGLIFAILILELFFRLFPEYRAKYSLSQYAIAEDSLVSKAMNRERDYRIYKPSAILGYELVPDSDPKVNSFGMIGNEHRLKKDKDVYRILILGDSITAHNWYVEKLETRLNDSGAGLKYDFEVWNGGVSGYQVDQYANYLTHKGLKYDPDMLIIGFCLNDFESLYYVYYKDEKGFTIFYNPAYELSKISTVNRYLFRYLHLYRFLTVNLNNMLPGSQKKYQENPDLRREGLHYMGIIKDTCQKEGIPILGVIFPYFKPFNEYDDYERLKYTAIITTLRALNIDFIDLHEYFPEEDRVSLRLDRDDDIHPSIEGHAVAAKAISGHLVKNYFLRGL